MSVKVQNRGIFSGKNYTEIILIDVCFIYCMTYLHIYIKLYYYLLILSQHHILRHIEI